MEWSAIGQMNTMGGEGVCRWDECLKELTEACGVGVGFAAIHTAIFDHWIGLPEPKIRKNPKPESLNHKA
jgi:hypothetical protein